MKITDVKIRKLLDESRLRLIKKESAAQSANCTTAKEKYL